MNAPCKDCGGRYCMCETCQSMRKLLEELGELKGEDIMKKEDAKKLFEEMKGSLNLNGLK